MLSARKVLQEVKFFVPGQKKIPKEFSFDVAIKNTNSSTAAAEVFVSSQRDNRSAGCEYRGFGNHAYSCR